MKHVMLFLSLSINPRKYPELVQKFRLRTVLFYYMVVIFFGLSVPALKALPILMEIPSKAAAAVVSALKYIPTGAKIEISKGALTTNLNEPFVVPIGPTDIQPNELQSQKPPSNLLVVDTNATVEDYAKLDTYILVTGKAIVGKSDNQLRAFTFDQLGPTPIAVTREEVEAVTQKILQSIGQLFVPIVVVVGLIIIFFSSIIGALLTALVNTIIIAILMWLGSVSIPFNKKMVLGALLGMYTAIWNGIWMTLAPPMKNPLSVTWIPTLVYTLILIVAVNGFRHHMKVKKPWNNVWGIILGILLALFVLVSLKGAYMKKPVVSPPTFEQSSPSPFPVE